MKQKVRFGNSVIQYTVVKSKRRKTSEIIVDKNGVVIRTPQRKPMSEIRKIMENKKRWIFKERLLFRDRIHRKIKTKEYSRRFLMKRVNFYASKLGIYPQKVVIKKLKSRWGSATKCNTINLNVSLLKAPKDAIDYVILHELCHLKIKDHSHHFWQLLHKFMPNYQDKKRWLDINSNRIVY